jgi:hypothetical protein
VAEVLEQARAGGVGPWWKFRDGAWDEPGIGGAASDLFPHAPTTRWFDVVHLADHDRFVLVASDGMAAEWGYLLRTSADGLAWTPPEQVGGTERSGEILYLGLAGTDLTTPRSARGDTVHLYRTRSMDGGSRRWDDVVVERRTLQHTPPAPV